MNEADTCRKHVVPRSQLAGWDDEPHSIAEQRTITDGRIVPVGEGFVRKPPKRVDVILTNPPFGGEEEKGIQGNFPEDRQTSETVLLFLQSSCGSFTASPRRQAGRRAPPLPALCGRQEIRNAIADFSTSLAAVSGLRERSV